MSTIITVDPMASAQAHLCAMCNLTFPTTELFYSHVKSHPQCATCKKYFKNSELLEQHNKETNCKDGSSVVTKGTAAQSHSCGMCNIKFSSRALFYAHISNHPQCTSCKGYFPNTELLKKHYTDTKCKDISTEIRADSKELHAIQLIPKLSEATPEINTNGSIGNFLWEPPRNLLCSKCNKTFASEDLLFSHYRKWHILKCFACKQIFETTELLEKHQKATKPGFQFKCCTCQVNFKTQLQLNTHLNTHIFNKCHICAQVFTDSTSFHDHYKVDHPNLVEDPKNHVLNSDRSQMKPQINHAIEECSPKEAPAFKCSECTRIFASQGMLASHYRTQHTKCLSCNKFFLHVDKLKIHQRSSKPGYLLKCCTCNVNCQTQAEFDSHLEGHITNECHVCQQSFTNNTLLQHHYKTEHADITETWMCAFCNIMFASGNLLYAHDKKWHTKCLICDKHIQDSVALRIHYRSNKSGFPFKCCICKVYCKNQPQFNRHINGHLIKQCHVCEQSVDSKELLPHHYKTAHPELTENNVQDIKHQPTQKSITKKVNNVDNRWRRNIGRPVEQLIPVQNPVEICKCGICHQSFSGENGVQQLVKHVRKNHQLQSKSESYTCYRCRRKFSKYQLSSLKDHMHSLHSLPAVIDNGSSLVVAENGREYRMALNETWMTCLQSGTIYKLPKPKSKMAVYYGKLSGQSEIQGWEKVKQGNVVVKQQPILQNEDVSQIPIAHKESVTQASIGQKEDAKEEPIGQKADVKHEPICQEEHEELIGQKENATEGFIGPGQDVKNHPIGQNYIKEELIGQNDEVQKPSVQNEANGTGNNSYENIPCNICQRSLKTVAGYISHLSVHNKNSTQKKVKNYHCGICNCPSFPSQSKLIEHRRLVHGLVNTQSNGSDLYGQISAQNGDTSNDMYSCPLCNKAFFLKVSLERHIENHPVVSVEPEFQLEQENQGTAFDIKEEDHESHERSDIRDHLDKIYGNSAEKGQEMDQNSVKSEGETNLWQESLETGPTLTDELISSHKINAVDNERKLNGDEDKASIDRKMENDSELESQNIVKNETNNWGGSLGSNPMSSVEIISSCESNDVGEERRFSMESEHNYASSLAFDIKDEAIFETTNLESESKFNVPSDADFGVKNESSIEATDLTAADNVPNILEIKPMEDQKILYKCSLCPEIFTEKGDLSKHFKLEHQMLYFKMVDQGLKGESSALSKSKSHGAHHIHKKSLSRRKKGHRETLHKCNVCQKSFTTQQSLNFHKRSHAQIKNKFSGSVYSTLLNLKCSESGEDISSREALFKHRGVHPECRPYSCRHCQAIFKLPCSLRKHEEKHLITSMPRKLKCRSCKRAFWSKEELEAHNCSRADKGKHKVKESKIFLCHICGSAR